MATPIIELRNVNKSFGPIDVLLDISLKVDAGEVLCLLGDNGAGKSTLIKVLSGVHQPTSGNVLMDGQEVLRQPARGSGKGHRHRLPVRRNFPADERRALLLCRTRTDEEIGSVHVYDRAKANATAVKSCRNSASPASTTATAWSAACRAVSASPLPSHGRCISAPGF